MNESFIISGNYYYNTESIVFSYFSYEDYESFIDCAEPAVYTNF